MASMTVSLSDPVKEWVEECIKNGRYATASAYVSDLIRRDRAQRDGLIEALVEGERSGTSHRTVEDIIAAAKASLSNGQV